MLFRAVLVGDSQIGNRQQINGVLIFLTEVSSNAGRFKSSKALEIHLQVYWWMVWVVERVRFQFWSGAAIIEGEMSDLP